MGKGVLKMENPLSLPAEFSIWTREAGAGGLAIAVEGPSRAEISFDDHKDGSCGVSYVAQEPGRDAEGSGGHRGGGGGGVTSLGLTLRLCLPQETTRSPSSSTSSTSPTAPTWCPWPLRPMTRGASLLLAFR